MAKTLIEMTKGRSDAVKKLLDNANASLTGGKAGEYAAARAKLDNEVKELNTLLRKVAYADCMATGEPFKALARAFTYKAETVHEVRDDNGIVSSLELEKKDKRLSLDEFIKYGELDTTILSDINCLLQLLEVREKHIMTLSDDDLAKKSVFFCSVVKAKSEGKTPDSNRQICKAIQSILDKCEVEGKIVNPDMNFIQQCAFVHDARGKCRVKPVTAKKFQSIMVDVLNHFVEGTAYSVFVKAAAEDDAVKAAA